MTKDLASYESFTDEKFCLQEGICKNLLSGNTFRVFTDSVFSNKIA